MRLKLVSDRDLRRMSAEERFWLKVDKAGPDECWLWTAAKRDRRLGYGGFNDGNRSMRAHRYAWELVNGPIPDGLKVCHRCDDNMCVNPAHLFLGTQAENMADCAKKGRKRPGEQHQDAKITEDDVRAIRQCASFSTKEIGRVFGLSHSHISKIRRGIKWACVK